MKSNIYDVYETIINVASVDKSPRGCQAELYNSAFTGTYTFPESKYYDKYSYGESSTEYTKGKLGDAIKEMAPASKRSWYSDYSNLPYSRCTWVRRGASGSNIKYSQNVPDIGIFYSECYFGPSLIDHSTHAVLSIN